MTATGVLPDRAIRALIDAGAVAAAPAVADAQIQPASLDLRLGDVAYRVRASFLVYTCCISLPHNPVYVINAVNITFRVPLIT